MTDHDDRLDDDDRIRERAVGDPPSGHDRIDPDEEVHDVLTHLLHYRESPLASTPERGAALRGRMSALLGQVRPDLVRRTSTSPDTTASARLRQVLATLVMDSARPGLAGAGLRSAAERVRQVTFVSEISDLDLEISPTDDRTTWSVSGQLGLDQVPSGLML